MDKFEKDLLKEIEELKKKFAKGEGKQCDFCGNYYDSLPDTINERYAFLEGYRIGMRSPKSSKEKNG